MKIVILGATGQIGSLIYNALKGRYDVVGTSRKRVENLIQFDPFSGNWSTLGTTDVLVNCVGQIDAGNASSFYKIHVDLSRLIIENREKIGAPRVIQISALGASVDHNVEFLRTKGIADDYLLQYQDTAVVRPSIVCTHRTMIVRKMLLLMQIAKYSQGLVVIPKGFLGTKIQPVIPQDLCDIVEYLCTTADLPKTINVAGPERYTFQQLLQIMFDVNRMRYRMIQVPKFLADILIKHMISRMFPGLINEQQYRLLFEDNVTELTEMKRFLGSGPTPTKQFFLNEFSYASH